MNPEYVIKISKLKISKDIDQIIIVIPEKYTSSLATFFYFIMEGEKWKEFLKSEACIGRDR